MSELEYHVIRVTLILHRLQLNVRFPCNISFQIKNQHNITEGIGLYELINGQCTPDEKIVHDMEILLKNDCYDTAKIGVISLMTSVNGKIPAGTTLLEITHKKQLLNYQIIQCPIEKCPDKAAKIVVSLQTQFVRSYRKSFLSHRSERNIIMPISHKKQNYSQSKDHKQYFTSRNSKHDSKKSSQKRYSSKLGIRNVFNDKEQSLVSSRLSNELVEQIRKDEQQSLYRLEREKASYIKEISRLKGQVYSLKKSEKWNTEELFEKYRAQIDKLSNEVELLKDRNRNFERKDRQNSNVIKELRDQVEKTKARQNQSQILRNQLKYAVQCKQKTIRERQTEIKMLREEYEDTKIAASMQEKRIELKENAYRQQIKKLTEKYQQNQMERQKATFEMNNLLLEMEKSQKKNQSLLKEKEKTHLQEKNSFIKKVQALNRNLERVKNEKSDLETEKKDLLEGLKNHSMKEREQEENIFCKKLEMDSLSVQIHKKNLSLKNLEKDVEELQQTLTETEGYRRRYHQLSIQQKKDRENLEKQLKGKVKLQAKIKELEVHTSNLANEKQKISLKVNQIIKQMESLSKLVEGKEKQIESLNQALSSATDKVAELKTKSQSQRYYFDEEKLKLNDRVTFFTKKVQYLENELQQIKWKEEKATSSYTDLREKINHNNSEILRLNEAQLNAQQKNKKLIEENKEKENEIRLLASEKQEYESKKRQFIEEMREKNQINHILQKKKKQLEQQLFMISEKLRENQLNFTEKIKQKELLIKEETETVAQRNKIIQNLKVKVQQKQIQIQNIEIEKRQKDEEILFSNQETLNLQQQFRIKQRQVQQANQKIQSLVKELQDTKEQIQKAEEAVKSIEKSTFQTESKWGQYQELTFKAFTVFIEEISKGELSQQSLVSFPDLRLSELQIQCVKNVKAQKIRNDDKIKELQETKIFLQAEISKNKQIIEERENEHEQAYQGEKEKGKTLQKELQTEKIDKIQKCQKYEEQIFNLKSQNQKMLSKIDKYCESQQELNNKISQVSDQIYLLQQKNKSLQKQVENYKKQAKKEQQQVENQLQKLKHQNFLSIEKLQKKISESEKKILQLENVNAKKQTKIKEIQGNFISEKNSRQKMQQKAESLTNKVQELMKQNGVFQRQNKSLEKKIKEKLDKEAEFQAEIITEKFKFEEQLLKSKKITEQLLEKEISLEKIKNQKQAAANTLEEAEEFIKKLVDRSKTDIERYQSELKLMQQNLIQLSNDIELKTFLVEQNQTHLKELRAQNIQLTHEVFEKKNQIISLKNSIEEQKSEIIYLHHNIENECQDKTKLLEEKEKNKEKIDELLCEMHESSLAINKLDHKESDLKKIKEDLLEKEKSIAELKNTIISLKKEINLKEEEHRNKLRESRRNEGSSQYQRYYLQKVNQLERQNHKLCTEIMILEKNIEKEKVNNNEEIISLKQLLIEKESILNEKNDLLEKFQLKINTLNERLRECIENQAIIDIQPVTTILKSQKNANKSKETVLSEENKSQ